MFVSVFSSRLSSATAFILISVLLVSATYVQWPEYRPFCLTSHASAHAQTYLRMLFVARMKSHIQLKRSCSIEYSSFNLCLRALSLNAPFVLEPPKLILYTILNVKFLPFV